MKKNENGNSIVIIVTLFIGVVLVFLFPKIHNYIYKMSVPKLEDKTENVETTPSKVTDEVIDSIHFPRMRSSKYSSFTYYSLDSFKISDMSNGDILYNAFMDLFEGNIVDSGYYGECTNLNRQFNPEYIELRVKNILGKNVKYTLEDFTVPSDSSSNYKGIWHYNGSVYYYGGMCNYTDETISYYDLKRLIEAKYDNEDIVITYYVAFAKVTGDSYTIYSDPNMEKSITSGSGDVEAAFESLDNKNLRKYEYRFKNTLCSYDEYCLYEGKWLNV